MPADWKFYEVKKEGDLFQVFCTAEPMEVASEDFDTGMIYVRYEAASARVVRILCCYEQGKDRLHVLTFRTTGPDLGAWEPFVEACFQTADFG